MTAATSERLTSRRSDDVFPSLGSAPIGAGETILAGTIVCLDSADSGRAVAGATGTGLICAGRARATYGSATVLADAVTVEFESGCFAFKNSASGDAIAADDVGKACYVVDNQTVALTSDSGARSYAGNVFAVDSYGVWVTMSPVNAPNLGTDFSALAGDVDGLRTDVDALPATRYGTATLVGGTVTVTGTITAGSRIAHGRNTGGGTLGNLSAPSASRTVGTAGAGSFVIQSTSGTDTSTVDYIVIG